MKKFEADLNSGRMEVEIKAWLDSPRELIKKLEGVARPVAEIKEEDIYFTYAHTKGYQMQRFRLRHIGGRNIVTVKIPSNAGKLVEANREFEFEVSDPEAFKVFCAQFGFRVLIEKIKQVKRFSFHPDKKQFDFPVTIELNHVEDLGDFIELETIVDKDEEVPRAFAMLKNLLDQLGIPRSKIEPIAYTELLYNKMRLRG